MFTEDKSKVKRLEKDIRVARTLPADLYRDPQYFSLARERIFATSWQFVGNTDELKVPGQVLPRTLLEGYLNEPLVFTRDNNDKLHCMPNICTHRGNLLVEGECHTQQLRCRYHGRRFALDGKFVSTPGFNEASNFPTESDNLPAVSFGEWAKLLFASVAPAYSLEDLIGDMQKRVGWLPFDDMTFEPTLSRDYMVRANWALYVDNYLEGFHVPYVHPELAVLLDTKDYQTELYPLSSLQVGVAARAEDAFVLPKDSPDFGKNIAAYYYWLFPNTMFNFYPWGISINVVVPLSIDRTRIRFFTYVYDRSRMGGYSTDGIDKTEREDENIVEQVQKGIASRFYKEGRYSPQWETAVHHFHQLLEQRITIE